VITHLRVVIGSWIAAWSMDSPPHQFALLRIVLGATGLLGMAGLTPVDMFWPLNGLAPIPSPGGPRDFLDAHGLGTVTGWLLFSALTAVFAAMTIGYRSNAAVLASFVGLVGQMHWNRLPLSSAHQVLVVLLFCLVWADSSRVWSVDAWLTRSVNAPPARVPSWPLLLMRGQVALIYFSSGLWKISYPMWRDGSAVHWALSLNIFHRLPWPVPVSWSPVVAAITWSTVLFEIFFPLLVLFRATRGPTLVGGILLHLGLLVMLELGPFSYLMMASYLAFVDPDRIPDLFQRRARLRHRVNSSS